VQVVILDGVIFIFVLHKFSSFNDL